VFEQPEHFVGQQLNLSADVRARSRSAGRSTRGSPDDRRRLPMPVRLFERFAPDTAALWRWARTARLDADPARTRGIVPDLLTVETWLERQFTDHRRRRVRK
jgi:hypothetical protein